ncbi:hypothetical protein HHK36_006931 [Tetracentron sinense]|uniref:DUF1639 family protein n=1 Tax=Tetracentron sinense TaxID=13715 RepID=A0A834ZI13_TETSI|nr:hypothetical protein HHK36_006931 [Tetracentron sinense]
MEISGVSEGEKPPKFIVMAPERSKPLHNFSLPNLKWGNQKFLRCKKVNSNGEISSADRRSSTSEAESEVLINSGSEHLLEKELSLNGLESFRESPSQLIAASATISKIERNGDGEIEAIGEHLMFATEKMKVMVPEARPWNLRTRSAVCKAPNKIGGRGGSMNEKKKQKSSHMRTENQTNKSIQGVEKKEPCKLSISLSREEIEEDFMLMLGTKPSRRPKKRAKIVQNYMDSMFPGLWLSEVTPDSYKVPDCPNLERGSDGD